MIESTTTLFHDDLRVPSSTCKSKQNTQAIHPWDIEIENDHCKDDGKNLLHIAYIIIIPLAIDFFCW